MNVEPHHPTWCSPEACNAYDPEPVEGLHRSTPIVVDTDDPSVGIFVYLSADPDGGNSLTPAIRPPRPRFSGCHSGRYRQSVSAAGLRPRAIRITISV